MKVERERKTKRKREITQRRADRVGAGAGHRDKNTEAKRRERGIPHPDEAYGAQNQHFADSVRNDGGFHGLPRWGAALRSSG